MCELILLKLGGSLLTDKRRPETARVEVIDRLAAEIARTRRDGGLGDRRLIVGHGSGSFGHVAAARAGLRGGGAGGRAGSVDAASAAAVQRAAMTLHRLVVDALEDAGAAPFSLPPSAWMMAEDGVPATAHVAPIVRALEIGAVPVVCGDVVLDRTLGATICSTETVFDVLIDALGEEAVGEEALGDDGFTVARVLWLGETAGIYDTAGATVARVTADNASSVRRMIGEAAGTDVTGGMLLRLETARDLADRGIESWILDGTVPGLLATALAGDEVPGTHVVA